MPPPPALYLAPPAFLESPQDKEERQRQQKLIDESRKKREDKFEGYRDHFAKDYPKSIAAHYFFLPKSIITDLERAVQNIMPPTSNVMTHYRVMKERLLSKHGPNSQKDAEETRKKLEGLHGDHRGWDVYLAAHDSLVGPRYQSATLPTIPLCNQSRPDHIYQYHQSQQVWQHSSHTKPTMRPTNKHGTYSIQTIKP
jgi:hypothetical protein